MANYLRTKKVKIEMINFISQFQINEIREMKQKYLYISKGYLDGKNYFCFCPTDGHKDAYKEMSNPKYCYLFIKKETFLNYLKNKPLL
jgi:hypothetical protein